jgi:hypothetical protein
MTDLPSRHEGEGGEAPRTRFWQLAGAVFWAFFGVRKSAALEKDAKNLKPAHVIIAGIFGALIFIAALVLIVNWVVGSGVASHAG